MGIQNGNPTKPFYVAAPQSFFVDALSHALIAANPVSSPGSHPLIPFAVLGR